MTPELYERVCQICYDTLQLELSQRSAFLTRVCNGDAWLRREVEAMLTQTERADSFLASPAITLAATQLAGVLDLEHPTRLSNDRSSGDGGSFALEIRADSLAPGMNLGWRYLIEKELGQGGTCAVFLARDQKLHQTPVVIKVLLRIWEQSLHKAWYEKKFKEEIAALARIDHPGVVRALDVGELPDGRTYLVMQYVCGVNLRAVMTLEGMDLKTVANLVRQMGQAVAAAHQQGVIHRDLKPENVMLHRAGDEQYAKLIDFGIATVYELPGAAENRTTEIIGTRSYLAPEQLHGKPVAASDIYALGVITYEMVTGRLPFNPESIPELYELQRAGVKIKPCDLRPALPEATQAVILKALSLAPEDRFASAKDFTDAFVQTLSGEAPAPLPQPRRWPGRGRWLLIISLVLAVVIGLIGWRRFKPGGGGGPGQNPAASIVTAKRYLNYTITAQRDPNRYPRSKPFSTFDNVIFGAGDQIRFYIRSPQSGSLYILNEGPMPTDGVPNFNILFPDLQTNGGSSKLEAGQVVQIPLPSEDPQQDWFVFDQEEGVERLWLIWSEREVPELEAVKRWANSKDGGAIDDSKQRVSVAAYLTGHSAITSVSVKDDVTKQTRLTSTGETLIWLLKLEHH